MEPSISRQKRHVGIAIFVTWKSFFSGDEMDNCEVKYGELTRTVATRNVTVAALKALFNMQNNSTCWLRESRGLSDTYVFADDNGAFPQLESFGVYELQVSQSQREIRNTKRNLYESSDEESSDEFMQTAYRLATSGGKSAKKGKRKVPKLKGKTPLQGNKASPAAMVENDHASWYFKVTIGERVESKIRPLRNCLVKCNINTSCSDVKVALSRELFVQPANLILFDSDFLEISDSPGRVGKIWFVQFCNVCLYV